MDKSFVTSHQRVSGSFTSQISLSSLFYLCISCLLSHTFSLLLHESSTHVILLKYSAWLFPVHYFKWAYGCFLEAFTSPLLLLAGPLFFQFKSFLTTLLKSSSSKTQPFLLSPTRTKFVLKQPVFHSNMQIVCSVLPSFSSTYVCFRFRPLESLHVGLKFIPYIQVHNHAVSKCLPQDFSGGQSLFR